MPTSVIKRDGRVVPFDKTKIQNAIEKALRATDGGGISPAHLPAFLDKVIASICGRLPDQASVELIQDEVENTLIRYDCVKTAKAYILYRANRAQVRNANSALMDIYRKITYADSAEADIKRENANIDCDSAMGVMLKYGSEGSKFFLYNYVLPKEFADAHINGDCHIHDADFYMLTETCCQIDIMKLFKDGFFTGHGYLREPNSIGSYASLACIAIQSDQNDMHEQHCALVW